MSGLTGTIWLARLALRRDRVTLSVWVLGLTGFLAATTAMFVDALATYDDVVQETALSTNNPGLRMLGLTSGPSVGGATMVRDYVSLAVLAGVMSTLAVVRHTRQNEELGRAEMVGATVVGRYAGLAAAVVVTVGANIVLAVLLGLAMMANGQSASGSLTAGASVAAVGVAFVGVAAITSQLASTARGAIGLASAVLGMAFLLSGVGNMLGTVDSRALRVTSAWPVWLSPIGWGQQMRPFGGDHWWPLAVFAALIVCMLAVAVVLVGRRDVGRGVWPERRGRAHASITLLSPTGLVWRLQRGALLGWVVGLLGFGLVFGALSEQIQDVKGSALEWYTRMGGTDQILDAYRASIVEMAGMTVAIYAVQMLLRMRVDEAEGTLESVLATGVNRPRWVLGHVLNTAAGAVVLILVFAVSMGLAAGQMLGGTSTQVREMIAAGLVQLPGILAVGGAVIAAAGLLPRWAAPLSWAVLLASLLLGPLFGPTLGLPQWVQNLSPFTHIPKGAGHQRHRRPDHRTHRDLSCSRGDRRGGDPPAEPRPPRLRTGSLRLGHRAQSVGRSVCGRDRADSPIHAGRTVDKANYGSSRRYSLARLGTNWVVWSVPRASTGCPDGIVRPQRPAMGRSARLASWR